VDRSSEELTAANFPPFQSQFPRVCCSVYIETNGTGLQSWRGTTHRHTLRAHTCDHPTLHLVNFLLQKQSHPVFQGWAHAQLKGAITWNSSNTSYTGVYLIFKLFSSISGFILFIYNFCVCVYIMIDFEMIFYFSFLDFVLICIECIFYQFLFLFCI